MRLEDDKSCLLKKKTINKRFPRQMQQTYKLLMCNLFVAILIQNVYDPRVLEQVAEGVVL